MSTEAIPLTAEDQAILSLESAHVVGHTCKVVAVGGSAPDVGALRALIASRLEAAPALTRRLSRDDRDLAWVPDERFDLDMHVVLAPVDAPVDQLGLRSVVAGLFAERLDRDRPLWRMDLVPLEGGRGALVWRIHHAVADGTTAMRFARELLWDAEAESAQGAAKPAHRAAAEDDSRRRGHLAGFLRREFSRSRAASPFDGRIGAQREVAFADAPFGALHDAAKRIDGATVNDAVLAVVAGALRRWIETHHGTLGEVRVRVPVSLHHQGDDAGNRDSFFAVSLPLTEPDPVARLRAVHAATAERKADHDADEMDALERELARVSPRLQRFCDRIQASPRRFALNVSNVPGPRGPVSVLGAPVTALHSLAEIGERHALRVAVVSYADALRFGLCADPDIVHDLHVLAGAIESEAAALVEACEA